MHRIAASCLLAAACAAPSDPPTRAEALDAAARAHDVPAPWLYALAYQQGRFEIAGVSDGAADAIDETAADALADTVVDEAVEGVDEDGAPAGADVDRAPGWGLMYLTDAQVARGAELTGASPDAIRDDLAANVDAAAALLVAGGSDDAAVRAATVDLLGVADDPDAASFALADLDAAIADGFDVVTSDGEELVLEGSDRQAIVAQPQPGKYPARQWIPSPNHSSRLGYSIRYVVVHDIEGTMASAIQVFKKSANQASAHYIVRARDGHVVQMVHEGDNAWHAGHGWFNRHSIGIEHEGFAYRKNGGGYYVETQYRASAALTCAIAVKHHIPIDRKHIFGHYNVPSNLSSHSLCGDAKGVAGACGGVSHHSDPGRYWKWQHYMKLVRDCVAAS